jgi:uncharacterized protein YprB with RNaseH-like and TPR domain
VAPHLKGRLARIKALGLDRASDLERPRGDEKNEAIGSSRSASKRRAAKPAPLAGGKPSPDFLKGWEKRDEYLWSRTLHFNFDMSGSIDPAAFAPLNRSRSRPLGRRTAKAAPVGEERVASERLRFFDLETTGLSGGAGTIAFLAAVGRADDDGFELTQLFLQDFPGEASFILALLELLRDGVVVSYNGKAFDMPLLRTRCVMNAIPAPAPPHIDALFASRRLWKRVHGGAALELLEKEVLGLERLEDIPGSMIPEVWLGYARTGEAPLMRQVLSHNAEDVASLARLVSKAQSIFDRPRAVLASSAVDRAGLGRSLLAMGRGGEGEELLEAAAGDGDGAAALFLARRYRISGREADCRRVEPLLAGDYKAATERAKACERLFGDLAEAARWAAAAMELAVKEEERQEAGKRIKRIERKIRRAGELP